jgi:hypothetical protein
MQGRHAGLWRALTASGRAGLQPCAGLRPCRRSSALHLTRGRHLPHLAAHQEAVVQRVQLLALGQLVGGAHLGRGAAAGRPSRAGMHTAQAHLPAFVYGCCRASRCELLGRGAPALDHGCLGCAGCLHMVRAGRSLGAGGSLTMLISGTGTRWLPLSNRRSLMSVSSVLRMALLACGDRGRRGLMTADSPRHSEASGGREGGATRGVWRLRLNPLLAAARYVSCAAVVRRRTLKISSMKATSAVGR